MTFEIAVMIHEYKSGQPMPTELRAYADAYPDAYLDRSGNNLSPNDRWFRFHNPRPDLGDINGVTWFHDDPRHDPDKNPDTYLDPVWPKQAPEVVAESTPEDTPENQ